MEDRPLNEKESLALIAEMIESTKRRFVKNSGAPFLIWGYTTLFVSLLVWYLFKSTSGDPWLNLAWFLIPVIGGSIMLLRSRKREKPVYVKSYIDQLIGSIWTLLGLSVFVFSVLAMFVRVPVLFMVLLLMSIGASITGLLIRFKPSVICGIVGIALSFALLVIPQINPILFFAVGFVPMIVAGHWLNCLNKKIARDV
jgi:hypothetical protein